MKKLLLIAIVAFFAQEVFAQGYNQSVGIRGGISSGFEYRVFTDDYNSYKALLSTRNRGLQFHAIKEFHRYDMFSFAEQLVFYYGAGIHVGYERWDVKDNYDNVTWYETRSSVIAGMDGLAGLEYVFYDVPISIGFEVKPYFDLLGKEFFQVDLFDFAFTVKYLF